MEFPVTIGGPRSNLIVQTKGVEKEGRGHKRAVISLPSVSSQPLQAHGLRTQKPNSHCSEADVPPQVTGFAPQTPQDHKGQQGGASLPHTSPSGLRWGPRSSGVSGCKCGEDSSPGTVPVRETRMCAQTPRVLRTVLRKSNTHGVQCEGTQPPKVVSWPLTSSKL